jgi:hypothetical protein
VPVRVAGTGGDTGAILAMQRRGGAGGAFS